MKNKIIVTAIERLAHKEIEKSMNHKLNFKKNPHNDPRTVQNVLVKNTQKNIMPATNFSTKKSNETKTSKNNYKSVDKISKQKTEQNQINGFIPLFVATPSILEFTNYTVGGVMTQSLSLLNISTISRSIRVVPPSSERFGMSPLLYPSGERGKWRERKKVREREGWREKVREGWRERERDAEKQRE